MAEEKHHHHLFHHRKEEESSGEVDYEKKEKHHKHLEQLGGLGAIAAGAYALVSAAPINPLIELRVYARLTRAFALQHDSARS
jgi:hypothetical protein